MYGFRDMPWPHDIHLIWTGRVGTCAHRRMDPNGPMSQDFVVPFSSPFADQATGFDVRAHDQHRYVAVTFRQVWIARKAPTTATSRGLLSFPRRPSRRRL